MAEILRDYKNLYMQKKEDAIVKLYIEGVIDGVEKINILVSALRDVFIKAVPFQINLRQVRAPPDLHPTSTRPPPELHPSSR